MAYLLSKNLTVGRKRTSVRLEPEIWDALENVRIREGVPLNMLVKLIADLRKKDQSLSSAIRVFLMKYYQNISDGRSTQIEQAAKNSQVIKINF